MSNYEYYNLINEENTHSCPFYPDDCRYCQNCNFTWMLYEYDETIDEWIKINAEEK